MNYRLLLFVTFSVMAVAACKPKPVPIDASSVCAVENEKKYVVTSGYLDDRGSIFCSNIGGGSVKCGMDVVATPNDKRIFGADILQGSGADQIEKLQSGYKSDDIKVHDDSGAAIKLSDKVTLTGQMSIAPDGSVCFMTVDKIER
jgi:hypothetical protein